MLVISLVITRHRMHCTPLPPVRLSRCSIKLCRPTWRCDVSVTHAANRRAIGLSFLQSPAQLTSSVLQKNWWHICWPTVTRIQVDSPRFWRGKTVPNFSTCRRVHTVPTVYTTIGRYRRNNRLIGQYQLSAGPMIGASLLHTSVDCICIWPFSKQQRWTEHIKIFFLKLVNFANFLHNFTQTFIFLIFELHNFSS